MYMYFGKGGRGGEEEERRGERWDALERWEGKEERGGERLKCVRGEGGYRQASTSTR